MKKPSLQLKIQKARKKRDEENPAPRDIGAEKALLGCAFLDWKILYEVGYLESDSFYMPSHQKIFSVMLYLLGQDKEINYVTVSSELESRDELEGIGAYYLTGLVEGVPSAVVFAGYAKEVFRTWKLRCLIEKTQNIQRQAFSSNAIPEEIAMSLWQQSNEIVTYDKHKRVTVSGEFKETRPKLMRERKKETRVILSQWESVNSLLFRGFVPETVSVLAGRPGLGKTTAKLNLINYWCSIGLGVYDYTPEQGVELERDGLLGNLTGVPMEYLQNPREFVWPEGISEEEYRKDILVGEEALDNYHLCIDGTRGISFAQLTYELERWKANHPLDILVIDLISRLKEISSEIRNKNNVIASVLDRQEELAQKLDIHIMNIWQIHRLNREDKKPQLDDLKDSGAAEETCSLIMLMYREKYYDPSSPDDSTELRVAKQRGGGDDGTAKLQFKKPNILVDYSDEEDSENKNDSDLF